jgi:heme/copper-type cytochrome/quinol oxidase subunit 3
MMAKPIATTRSVTTMPTGRLAVWWVIVSEIFIFGGILATYIMHRLGHPEWAYQSAATNIWIGGFNTVVLLVSSFFAVSAHAAAEAGDGKKAFNLLKLTTLGGAVFLAVKSVEWYLKISHGDTITSSGFFSFYYIAAGLHALHVLAGMVIMMIVGFAASKGRELQRVEYIGIYWHFVDLVWIFLFPLLYIAK